MCAAEGSGPDTQGTEGVVANGRRKKGSKGMKVGAGNALSLKNVSVLVQVVLVVGQPTADWQSVEKKIDVENGPSPILPESQFQDPHCCRYDATKRSVVRPLS